MYLEKSKEDLEIQLTELRLMIPTVNLKLGKLQNKKKVFSNYFNNLRKRKQYNLDKREEAIILDQFNSLRKTFGSNIEDI